MIIPGWYARRRSLARVAEWQTRTVQVRVSVRTWGFNSPLAHTEISGNGTGLPATVLVMVALMTAPATARSLRAGLAAGWPTADLLRLVREMRNNSVGLAAGVGRFYGRERLTAKTS